MYKRGMLFLLILGFSLFGIVNTAEASSQNFFSRYCEDADNPNASPDKMYFVAPGQEKEICIYFYTTSPEPMELNYYFSDTTVNSQWGKSCSTDQSSTNAFSKHFINTGEKKVIVVAEKPALVKEKIAIPLGMSWELNGCIAYSLSKPVNADKSGSEVFAVTVRKVGFLSFFVGSNESIKNDVQLLKNAWWSYSTNSKIKAQMKEGNMVLSYLVQNNGNTSQDIVISWTIHNIFWFEKIFEGTPTKINPGEKKEIEVMVGILPAYKWFFTVRSSVQNTPVFNFDTSNMDEKYTSSGFQTITWTIYIFSWVSLIIVLLVIAFIVKLVAPRKVKVVQQQ